MRQGRFYARAVGRAAGRQEGITLIELLVVIAIMAILATAAMAVFVNQRSKATDAQAKANLVSAQKAMEAYFTENTTYVGANVNPPPDQDSLLTIEPSLGNPPVPTILERDDRSYKLAATSSSQTPVTFELEHLNDGSVNRTCTPVANGGCPPGGLW
jgi:prepilin-type N-terminal cleavage/methylation domain-containing protein